MHLHMSICAEFLQPSSQVHFFSYVGVFCTFLCQEAYFV